MKEKNTSYILHPSLEEQLRRLGEDLRLARTLRGITMEDMAQRIGISRETLRRLENGHAGVSLGVVAQALWVLNLEGNINNIASLSVDERGQALVAAQAKNRVTKARMKTPRAGLAQSDEYDF